MTSAAFDLFSTFSGRAETAPAPRSAAAGESLERLRRGSRVFQELLARVSELKAATSERGWDGERGEPVAPERWEEASQLLRQCDFGAEELPPPFISACGDGSAHLQWTTKRGDRAAVEFGARSITWNFLGADGEDELLEDLPLAEAYTKVRALFRLR